MKRVVLAIAAVAMVLTTLTVAMTGADQEKKEVVGLTPERMQWFTPSNYKDGRQRARLFGDASQGGAWVDRIKIPSGTRALAHTQLAR